MQTVFRIFDLDNDGNVNINDVKLILSHIPCAKFKQPNETLSTDKSYSSGEFLNPEIRLLSNLSEGYFNGSDYTEK